MSTVLELIPVVAFGLLLWWRTDAPSMLVIVLARHVDGLEAPPWRPLWPFRWLSRLLP